MHVKTGATGRICGPFGRVAAAAEAFWRLAEAEPDLGALSQERFSFLADLSSLALAGAGVLRSCSRSEVLQGAESLERQ